MKLIQSFLLTSIVTVVAAKPSTPMISLLRPQGIRFVIPDQAGVSLLAVHYSINAQLKGTAAGQYNYDITSKTNGQWVHENTRAVVNPGDTVNYWLYQIANGRGSQVLNQAWTAGSATAKPTTKAPTTKSPAPPVTPRPTSRPEPPVTPKPTNRPVPPVTSGPTLKCTSYPCLIFEDEFDYLNLDVWEHEITAGGGGNWEFQYYTNNRSNSYVRDGKLFIKPTLTMDTLTGGPGSLTRGSLDLWGSQPGDICTGNAWWGCRREGSANNILNPIQSARLRSARGFSFKYGKVEIEAKMPTGDWLWPAIWLLPLRNAYGKWPASGEIDIVESRGNRQYTNSGGKEKGVKSAGSTLHFGTDYRHNKWHTAHGEKLASSGTYGDSFHKYVMVWDENHISMSIDDVEILNVAPKKTMWEYGGLDRDGNIDNPWVAATKMAPFDQEFFFILNVAVGGTAYFPDHYRSPSGKPWSDSSPTATRDFWNGRDRWYPTWNPNSNNGEDAAMQINYIRVYKLK